MGLLARHADKMGAAGSLFASLCCLGTPAILAFLAAIGAGFLVNDLILLPLLALSLMVALWGLGKGRELHGDGRPLRLGTAGALLIPAGIFAAAWLTAVGAALLIVASVWNAGARRRCEAGPRTGAPVALQSPPRLGRQPCSACSAPPSPSQPAGLGRRG
jgi:mercuric ion transport protein